MMHDMMMNGGMMWGMGIVWLLVVIALILATAALVKYLFFSRPRDNNENSVPSDRVLEGTVHVMSRGATNNNSTGVLAAGNVPFTST